MGFCDAWSGSRWIPDTAMPRCTLAPAPDKRKSLRSYTAPAKPDFTAERSAVSHTATSEWYYRGHQGAGGIGSLWLQVKLQANVLHGETLSCSLLSTFINISLHTYVVWPWPQHSTKGWHTGVWMCVCYTEQGHYFCLAPRGGLVRLRDYTLRVSVCVFN